jgi:small subunit ribosomal protein S9
MNELRRIALAGGEDGVAQALQGFLSRYERPSMLLQLSRRKKIVADQYGRTYALGRRKESSARVWMIPVKTAPLEADLEQTREQESGEEQERPPAQAQAFGQEQERPSAQAQAFGQEQEYPQEQEQEQNPPPTRPIDLASSGESVPTTTILINNLPLATYFPNTVDRLRVVRPFKVSGLFGAFNVFALVRGGGTTGQAGAIAHGIAKNIAAHVPEVEIVLRRGKHFYCGRFLSLSRC